LPNAQVFLSERRLRCYQLHLDARKSKGWSVSLIPSNEIFEIASSAAKVKSWFFISSVSGSNSTIGRT